MIRNKELYEFDEESNSTELETGLTPSENLESKFPVRLFYQTIISVICLMLLFTISSSQLSWLQWIGAKFHVALNVSLEESFGRISKSEFFKKIMTNAGNLIRLEEITKNISNQEITDQPKTLLQNAIWPVKGSITKGYGWCYETTSKMKKFNSGIEITAIPGSSVLAIADGIITEITQQPEDGWEIVINHGDGWTSTYHYLGQVNVKVGQTIKNGELIAQIGRPNQKRGPVLFLEIKDYDQPVNPLSILVS